MLQRLNNFELKSKFATLFKQDSSVAQLVRAGDC